LVVREIARWTEIIKNEEAH